MTATPSPQSVVVPVEPTDEMLLAAHEATAVGCCLLHPRETKDIWSAMLAAALATSSLAGGEVRERIKAILDEETTAGGTSASRSGAVNSDELAGLILAALSPEAPARVDARGICEALGFDPTNHHNAAACPYCIPDEALRNEIKARALTPRHEAPACEMCNGRGEVGGPTGQTPESFEYVTECCPDCGGTGKHEAPADALRWAALLIEKLPNDHEGRNSWLTNYGGRSPRVSEAEKQPPLDSTASTRLEQHNPSEDEPIATLTSKTEPVDVDASIAPIVQALWDCGLETVASCSGHTHRPGNIALKDGRELIIARDYEEARKIDALFPLNICGHEAPAEPVSDRYKFDDEIAWLREAARYFSVRDTKGEDQAHWANVYNAENARKLADRLAELSSNPCQLEAPAEGAGEIDGLIDYLENQRAETATAEGREIMTEWINALRARSSAPEAREGEAVAYGADHQPWCQPGDQTQRAFRLRFEDPDMREMVWTGPGAEKEALAAYNQYAPAWNVYLFSGHPRAAPSADKLREDVDRLTSAFDGAVSLSWRRFSLARDLGSALTWALAEIDGETKYETDSQRENCRDKADQALAALKAEGAK